MVSDVTVTEAVTCKQKVYPGMRMRSPGKLNTGRSSLGRRKVGL